MSLLARSLALAIFALPLSPESAQAKISRPMLLGKTDLPVNEQVDEPFPPYDPQQSMNWLSLRNRNSQAVYQMDAAKQGKKKVSDSNTNMEIDFRKRKLSERGGELTEELAYERMLVEMNAKASLPGDPMERNTRIDLGPYLKGEKLRAVFGSDSALKRVDGVEKIRRKIQSNVPDEKSREKLLGMLSPQQMQEWLSPRIDNLEWLEKAKGKHPGDSWQAKLRSESNSLDADFKFTGWSKVNGKPVAIVDVTVPRQQTTLGRGDREQSVLVSGAGRWMMIPVTHESAYNMKLKFEGNGENGKVESPGRDGVLPPPPSFTQSESTAEMHASP